MNGDAGRFANCHQSRNDRIRIVLSGTDDLRSHVGWNATHNIMDRRYHRDRLPVRIYASEDACRFDYTGQTLIDDIFPEMLQVQVDVVLLLANTPPFTNLDRLSTADHVA